MFCFSSYARRVQTQSSWAIIHPGFLSCRAENARGKLSFLVGWKTWLAGSPGGLGLDTSEKIFTFIVEFYWHLSWGSSRSSSPECAVSHWVHSVLWMPDLCCLCLTTHTCSGLRNEKISWNPWCALQLLHIKKTDVLDRLSFGSRMSWSGISASSLH